MPSNVNVNARGLAFHVGLHKTGTTFLQGEVFPRLNGIQYLRWRNLEYLIRLDETNRYLVSCEGLSGRTFAGLDERRTGLSRLAQMFPRARVIIGVRRHGDFLASLYSQYLRYGGTESFSGFLDPNRQRDRFPFNRMEVSFRTIVESTQDAFGVAPLVFDMAEMFRSPETFLDELCTYTGSVPGNALAAFEAPPRNATLRRWQGHTLRRINQHVGARLTLDGRNRPYGKLARWRLDPPTLLQRGLGTLPSPPLVSRVERQQVDTDPEFSKDWDWIRGYIAQRPWMAHAA
jgi:hypothetical protein